MFDGSSKMAKQFLTLTLRLFWHKSQYNSLPDSLTFENLALTYFNSEFKTIVRIIKT